MAKDILIVPGSSNIHFSGSAVNDIKLETLDSGSVAFTSNSGSLFTITNSFTGSLFSVGDVSGVPILDVNSNDTVTLGQFSSPIKVLTNASSHTIISGSTTSTASFGRVQASTLAGNSPITIDAEFSTTGVQTFSKAVYAGPSSENFYRIKLQDQGGIHNDVGIGQGATGNMGFNVGAGNYYDFYEGTNGLKFRLINGRIGVGETAPSAMLHISGSGVPTAKFYGLGAANSLVMGYSSATAQHQLFWDSAKFYVAADENNTAGSSQLHLRVDGNDRIVIDVTGESTFTSNNATVEIATTSNGTYGVRSTSPAKFNDYYFSGTSGHIRNTLGTSYMSFDASGNATIPKNLTVQGSITAQEFITELNTVTIIATSGSTKFGNDSSDTHAFSGSITSDSSIDVLGSIRRRNSRGSNAGLALLTTSSNHGVGEFYSSGGGLNARIHGGGSSFTLNRFGIGHTAPENGGLDIRANHSLGQFSVGDGSGNIYHRYYVSMSGAFGNGTAHFIPRGVPGSGTSNFTTHFKTASGGGSTEHHVVIDGKVGLGTTSPAGNKLHIHVGDSGTDSVTTNSSLVIESNTNNYIQMLNPNGNNSGILFGEHNNIDVASILHDGGDNSLRFTVASGERIRINGSGYVGIGQTVPTHTLHVKSSNGLFLERPAGTYGLQVYADNAGSYLKASANDLQIWTGATPSEKVRILQGGNVGIGSTSPGASLVVNSSAGNTARFGNTTDGVHLGYGSGFGFIQGTDIQGNAFNHLRFRAASDYGMILNTSNNVGIGTMSPVSKLHVLGSSYNHLELESASGNVGITFDVETSNTNYYDWRIDAQGTVANGFCIGRSTGLGNQTFSAASMIMTLKSSGDVGIGTTAPSNWLHLAQSTAGNHFNEGIRIVRGEFGGDATQYAIINNYNGTLNLINRGGSNHGYINLMSSNDGSTTRTMLQIDAREDQYLTPTGSAISYNVKGASGAAHGGGVSGSYIIYRDLEEKTVVHNGNDDYQLMKTFTPTKSGNVTLQFEAYISSGTYYWAFRVGRNGDGRNDSNTGAYQSYDSHAQALHNKPYSVYLDPSNTQHVHQYKKFNVNVKFLRAGETVDLYMVSSNGSGVPVTGVGQTLGMKNFVVRSDSPSAEINPIHSLGKNFGIGTTSPNRKLAVAGTIHVSASDAAYSTDSWSRYLELNATAAGGGGIIWKKQSSNISRAILANQGDMYFGRSTADDNSAGATYDMFIKRTGEVGIGDTSPAQTLVVSGSSKGLFSVGLVGGGSRVTIGDTSMDSALYMRRSSNGAANVQVLQLGSSLYVGATSNVINTVIQSNTATLTVGSSKVTSNSEIEINSNDGIDVNAGAATLNASHSGGTSALYSGYGFSTATSQTVISNANKINFNSPGTTRMMVSSSGFVGIGTTTPTSLLHVESTSTFAQLNIEGVNSNVAATLRFIHNGGGGRTNFDGNWNISRASSETNFSGPFGSLGGLAFWHQTGGGSYVDALRIKDDGNLVSAYKVGIGTTSPVTALLHAYGSNNSAGAMWTQIGAGNAPHIVVQNAGTTSNNNAGYFFKDNDGYVGGIGMRFTDHSPNKSKLIFSTANTETREIGAFNESGSLGVGLTNPEVYESSANNLVVKDYYDGTTAGITIVTGTTSKGKIHFADGTSGNASYRGYIFYDHNSDDGMGFGTSGTTKMFIDGTGNVGINDDSPSYKLDVNGTGRFTGVLRLDSSLNFNGSQTIGTVGQSDSLSINPDANLHLGTSSTDHTYIGASGRNVTINATTTTIGGALVVTGNLTTSGLIDGIDIANNVVTTNTTQTISGAKTHSTDLTINHANLKINSGADGSTGLIRFFDSNEKEQGEIYAHTSDELRFWTPAGSKYNFQNGGMDIAGDLKVDGTITARQFQTTIVSSSVQFSSGSTQFGDSQDDTHHFSGSVRIADSAPAANYNGTTLLVGSGSQHSMQFINNGAAYSSTPAGRKTILKLVNNAIGLGAQYNNGLEFSPYHNKAYAGIYFYWIGDTSNGRMEFRTTTDSGANLITAMTIDENQEVEFSKDMRFNGASNKLYTYHLNNANYIDAKNFQANTSSDINFQNAVGPANIVSVGNVVRLKSKGTTPLVASGSSVGIGTDSPTATLHVSGANASYLLKISTPQTTDAAFFYNGSSVDNGYFGLKNTSGNLTNYLHTKGNAVLGDATNNNVGVGGLNAGNSNFKLQIKEKSDANAAIRFTDTDDMVWGWVGPARGTDQIVTGTTNGDFVVGSAYNVDTHIVTSGSIRMTVRNDGNVGIGITNPSQKLYVNNGAIGMTTGNVITWNNGDAQIGAVSGYHFTISTYTGSSLTEKLRVTSGGNVGIGDTDPQAKLHVEIASHNDAVGFYNGSTALVYMRNESGTGRLTLQGSGGTINLESSNSRYSYINTSSNFGIGTSTPTAGKLHVAGNIYATGTLESGTPYFNLSSTSLHGYAHGLSSFVSTSGGWARAFRWYNNVSSTARQTTFFVGATGGGSGTSFGYLAIGDQASESTGYSFTKALRLYSDGDVTIQDGNLAIGHTSPNFSLDVRKSTSDPVAFFGFSQVNAENKHGLIVIQSGTIPQSGGDLSGEAGIIFRHSGGTGGSNFDGNAGSIKSLKMDTYAATAQAHNRLAFSTTFNNSDSEKMTIIDSGNVGIGTNNPEYLLHLSGSGVEGTVVGESAHTGWMLRSDDSNNRAFLILDDDSTDGVAAGGDYLYLAQDDGVTIMENTAGNIEFRTGGTTRVRINGDTLELRRANQKVSGSATSTGSFGHIKALSEYSMEVAEYITHFEDADTHIRFQNNNLDLTAGGNMVRLNTTGVGIGETSPSARLDIAAPASDAVSLEVGGAIESSAGLSTYGASATIVNKRNEADQHGLVVGAKNSDSFPLIVGRHDSTFNDLVVDGSGRVGIGNKAPTAALEIYGDGDSANQLRLRHNGSGTNGVLDLSVTDTEANIIANYSSTAIPLRFLTGATERVRIDTAGKVGIGTNAPGYPLEVEGATGNTVAKFGQNMPLYMIHNAPVVGFNLYYDGGYKFGEASSSSYGGYLGFSTGAGKFVFATSNTGNAGGTATMTERVTLLNNGNVGIGDTTPTAMLEVARAGSQVARFYSTNGDTDGVNVLFGATKTLESSHQLIGGIVARFTSTAWLSATVDFKGPRSTGYGDAVTYLTFTHDGSNQRSAFTGNVGIGGNPTSGIRLDVSAGHIALDSGYSLYFDGGSDTRMLESSANVLDTYVGGSHSLRLEADGDLQVKQDVVAFSSIYSDERLKDDVKTIDSALEKVKKLRGVEYVWNSTSRKGQKDIGVIAQETEKVLPEIVREKKMGLHTDSDEKFKTVDYEKLTAVLIESVKEQQKQIEELKSEIQELKDGSSK